MNLKEKPQPLLIHVDRCVRCLQPKNFSPLIRTNLIPNYVVDQNPLIFSSLSENRQNQLLVCTKDLEIIENQKNRAFERSGAIGVLNYLAIKHPQPNYGVMMDIYRRQLVYVFESIKNNIQALHGDFGDMNASQVKRLEALSSEFALKFNENV